jgi:predicted PurR-regulated permease PerM
MDSNERLTEPPRSDRSPPNGSADRFRVFALAAMTAVLLALCAALAIPFIPAVAWALALAIIAWPVHEWIARRVQRPGVAAALTMLLVVVVILVPGVFVAAQLASEAESATERAREEAAAGTIREKVAEAPGLGRVVAWMDRAGVDVEQEVRKVITGLTGDASAILRGSLAAILQAVVAVFILYHLLRDRSSLLAQVRGLLPLSRTECDRVFTGFSDSVYANLYATVITSVIDGLGGGLMFWALGLPSPVLWGVVMFFLSILPLVGTWLIWLPAAAYLGMIGRWPEALILLGWGAASSVVVDNVLYVRIAGDRMQMHQIPALLAFLGGLALFGASGMILGPAILAVTAAVLEVWRDRAARTDGELTPRERPILLPNGAG